MNDNFEGPGKVSPSRMMSLLLSVAVGAVVACAGSTPNVQSIPVTANPTEQIDALANRIEQARQAKSEVLAPTWFHRAEASLAGARELREQGGGVQATLALVAEGNAQVEQAARFTSVSENILPAVIKARSGALDAGAASLGSPYDEAEKSFLELTAAVEQDDIGWAQRKAPGVEKSFRVLELKAIKATSENEIQSLIKQARADGAEKLVPTILTATVQQAADLDAFITENRYASEEMNQRSAQALFQARRLVSLTHEAAAIRKSNPEAQALQREGNISAVAAELALPDLRDRDFASQISSITNAARELRKDRDYLVSQTSELREQLASLQGQASQQSQELARLEAERRFDDLYNEVSSYFAPSEAEVYKQGTQLVVRMRSIQFPVGESVLLPNDYEQLSKVQRAIRSFHMPTVVIEGHTDSTGSPATNDHLSQQRAEAVEAYLVANKTLPKDHITAVGRGSSEPLATNETAAGRAINRRIDIRIDAASQSIALPAVAAGAQSVR